MYFHYIYKASINLLSSLLIKVTLLLIILLIKVIIYLLIKETVNSHVIDFYINSYLIYDVKIFIFFHKFITCKIIYYLNGTVSPYLMFNILHGKNNIWALCFIF